MPDAKSTPPVPPNRMVCDNPVDTIANIRDVVAFLRDWAVGDTGSSQDANSKLGLHCVFAMVEDALNTAVEQAEQSHERVA